MSPPVDVATVTTKAMEQAKLAGLPQIATYVENVEFRVRRTPPVWVVHLRSGGVVFTAEIDGDSGKVVEWHKGYSIPKSRRRTAHSS